MDDQTLTHVMEAADLMGIPITRDMLTEILYAHAFVIRMLETGRPFDAEITAGFARAPRCENGHILDGSGVCRTCDLPRDREADARLDPLELADEAENPL